MLQDSISNPLPKVEGTWFVKHRDGWKELEAPTVLHPITPPPELVQQWADMLASRSDEAVFSLAAQWGADQELEACCALLDKFNDGFWCKELRAARRPKPPSLKEQALAELAVLETAGACYAKTIRRALEQIND